VWGESVIHWNYIGVDRSNPSFVVKFYDSVTFSVYVRLKFRATDKIMARKGLGRKRLLSNRRTTPEYGGKEMNTLSGWLVAVAKQEGRVYSYISMCGGNKEEPAVWCSLCYDVSGSQSRM